MSKLLKPVSTIGGTLLGGALGGVPGALIGGALGSSFGGVGSVSSGGGVMPWSIGTAGVGPSANVMDLAKGAGFNTGISTNAFSLSPGGALARRDMSMPNQMINIEGQLQGLGGNLGALRSGLSKIKPDFGGTAANLAELRGQVRPGFGRLTEARVKAIRDAGAESMGNLRESLGRRGVQGSSFANDAESRVRMATGQEEERARAEATVQEIGLSREIILNEMTNELTRFGAELGLAQEDRAILGQQAQVLAQRATQLSSMMDRELNELGVVGAIRSGINSAISQQAIQMAQLDMLSKTSNAQLQQQSAMANAQFGMQAQLANAGFGAQAAQSNAQNESNLMNAMVIGGMGLFGRGGVLGNA